MNMSTGDIDMLGEGKDCKEIVILCSNLHDVLLVNRYDNLPHFKDSHNVVKLLLFI